MCPDRPGGVAVVTGITGQDGHYLSRQLLDESYAVHGVVSPNYGNDGLAEQVSPHTADDWRPTKTFADIAAAMVYSDLGQEQSR
jgi:nucleoside-diphosphate-sugar epimerase